MVNLLCNILRWMEGFETEALRIVSEANKEGHKPRLFVVQYSDAKFHNFEASLRISQAVAKYLQLPWFNPKYPLSEFGVHMCADGVAIQFEQPLMSFATELAILRKLPFIFVATIVVGTLLVVKFYY